MHKIVRGFAESQVFLGSCRLKRCILN